MAATCDTGILSCGWPCLSSILLATAWLASCDDAPARASQAEQSRPFSSTTDTFLPLNIKPHGLPGTINDLNLSIWGQDSWRAGGDAYSPQYIAGATPNPEHDTQPYGYLFRVTSRQTSPTTTPSFKYSTLTTTTDQTRRPPPTRPSLPPPSALCLAAYRRPRPTQRRPCTVALESSPIAGVARIVRPTEHGMMSA